MNTLIIAAHPDWNASRANRALTEELLLQEDILIRDLYREYPSWSIDVAREQQLLLAHDRIVFQFPLYWYSCPPLLKKWFDDVLTFGWAFGPGGDHLRGKQFMVATTAAGPENAYRSGGENLYTISELLRPIERTVTKCNGTFLPAFVSYNVHDASDGWLAQEADRYAEQLRAPIEALIQ